MVAMITRYCVSVFNQGVDYIRSFKFHEFATYAENENLRSNFYSCILQIIQLGDGSQDAKSQNIYIYIYLIMVK